MAGFRVNRKTLARGGVRAGSDASNYTDISTGGYQTMTGCARVWNEIPLPARVWWGNVGACGHATTGSLYIGISEGASGGFFNVPTWSPSSATCDMHLDTALWAPPDIAIPGGSMKLTFDLITNTDMTKASGLGIRMNWNYITGPCSAKTASAIMATSTLSASTAWSRLSPSLTTLLPSFDVAGQLLLLHFRLMTSACGAAGNLVDFAGARLSYLADRLGASSM